MDREGYSSMAIVLFNDGRAYNYCSRIRCNNWCWLQLASDTDMDRRWRYNESVVIVSLKDGTRKHAFCGRKCAVLWLNSRER